MGDERLIVFSLGAVVCINVVCTIEYRKVELVVKLLITRTFGYSPNSRISHYYILFNPHPYSLTIRCISPESRFKI